MVSEVSLQYLQPIWVAAIRHHGIHDPNVTDSTWQELIVWASPKRLLGRSLDARGIGLLWDDPRQFDPRDRRYDVGVPIDPEDTEAVTSPGVVLVTAPGRYLKTTHHGPYEQMQNTYEAVFAKEMRYDGWTLLAQPIIEIYRNSPSEVSEEDLETDIYLPTVKL